MADTMVERLTGQATATAGHAEIQIVMTDQALFVGDHTPAHLDSFGPIPAALARQIVRESDRVWLRRLFTPPDGSALVAMDSRRRTFAGELRRFVIVRDEVCRTSWCDAPIRHLDHLVRAADGGATTADNAQALCQACNYAKEAAGWRATRPPGDGHEVVTETPTGHRYRSRSPVPPHYRTETFSRAEQHLAVLLGAA